MKVFLLISMEELLGRGTVTGAPEVVVEGKTGQPSTMTPFVPRTTRNACGEEC